MSEMVTDLVVVLDRSGSMEHGRADHEGGLRSFIRDQRRLAGSVRLTFVLFDSYEPFELVYDRVPLDAVDETRINLVPRGGTPLLEAVSRTLAHMDTRMAEESAHPIIVMVITDGQENASGPAYSRSALKTMIKAQQAVGWVLLYLGANVDEFAEAGGLGIGSANALGYASSARGIGVMYASLSANAATANAAWQQGDSTTARAAFGFTSSQRTASKPPNTMTGGPA